jgi:hypothetical protein
LLTLTLLAYCVAFFTSKVTSTSMAMLSAAACYVFICASTLYNFRGRFS